MTQKLSWSLAQQEVQSMPVEILQGPELIQVEISLFGLIEDYRRFLHFFIILNADRPSRATCQDRLLENSVSLEN